MHLESYLSLGPALADTPRLVGDCLRILFEKIRDLAEYLEALKAGTALSSGTCPPPLCLHPIPSSPPSPSSSLAGVPCCRPPVDAFQLRVGGCFALLEARLRPLLAFDDLKPEVFQLFR